MRKCSICKLKSEPVDMLIDGLKAVCRTVDCMASYSIIKLNKLRIKKEKDERRENRRAKEKLNETVPHWTKKAQVEFNKFIRLRDRKLPCVSCQRHHEGQYHAGHYKTTGSHPELRFNEVNCHKQCAPCNNHLSGNIIEYRIELARRIGLAQLEWLEGPHEPKRYKVSDLKELEALYKMKSKAISSENN